MDVDRFETSFLAIPESYRGRWIFGIILAIVHGKIRFISACAIEKFAKTNNIFVFDWAQHEYKDGSTSKDKKNKRRKKDKDSDAEEEPNASSLEPEKIENIKENFTGSVTPNPDPAAAAADTEPLPTVAPKTAGPFAQGDETNEIKK